MRLAFVPFYFFFFFSLGVSAQESVPEPACLYDFQCGGSLTCRAGVCQAPSFQEPGGADTVCGADRRCRIERLKRVNAARRQVQVHEEEEIARASIAKAQLKVTGPQVRKEKPITVDWRLSRAGVAGLAAGYSLLPQLKVEAQIFFYSDDFYRNEYYELDLHVFNASAIYFTHAGPLAGYAQAGFVYGSGGMATYDFTGTGDRDVVLHAFELQAGIDVQSQVGFHTRLGVAYRPNIYRRVTSSPGLYDTQAVEEFDYWYGRNAMIDVVFLIGWAF